MQTREPSAVGEYAQKMANELVMRSAAPWLQRHVRGYWGYDHRTAGPARQREPLCTGVVLIFGLGPKLGLVDRLDPERPPARFGSFVAGLDDACTVIEHDGELRGVQVDLTPLAARMIFRVPMHSLAREVVALDDLIGQEARRLEESLLGASTWAERFELVEGALAARLAAAEPPPPDVDWAWRRLAGARGRLRVADLAGQLGCSRQHLTARFREHVGLPPKLVARMHRFRHVLDRLDVCPETSLGEVAAACGYYDQAHLYRDFNDFAGTTPTSYLADRVPFVQDDCAADS